MKRTLLALASLVPAATAAHVPERPLQTSSDAFAWNFEAWLLALLALSAGAYALGLARLWRNAGRGRGVSRWQAAAYAIGWVFLVVALVSPLDTLGSHLFSAHMVQHELMMVVAAPLLVIGRPLATWAWALAPPQRRWFGTALRSRGWLAFWSALSDPLFAWALHALVLWAWHLPVLFNASLLHEGVHVAQHVSFLGTALLFWWSVLGRDPRGRVGPGHSAASLFTTMLHTAALGALLSLAPTPWYAEYVPRTGALGLDPLQDQQLGGLIMWVPAGLAYIVAGLAVLSRLLGRARA
jgi:putative membrane protein